MRLPLVVAAVMFSATAHADLSAGTHTRRWVAREGWPIQVKGYAPDEATVIAAFQPIDPDEHGDVTGPVMSRCVLPLIAPRKHRGHCPPLPVGHYRATIYVDGGDVLDVETYRLVVIPDDRKAAKLEYKLRAAGKKLWDQMGKAVR